MIWILKARGSFIEIKSNIFFKNPKGPFFKTPQEILSTIWGGRRVLCSVPSSHQLIEEQKSNTACPSIGAVGNGVFVIKVILPTLNCPSEKTKTHLKRLQSKCLQHLNIVVHY